MTAKFEIAAAGWRRVNALPARLKAAIEDSAGTLQQSLEEEIGAIIKRTQSGRDVEGGSFIEYSPKYKRMKVESGRSSTPNLTWTGKMLQAIRSKVNVKNWGLEGKIFFIPSQADKARFSQNLRNFFGLSKQQINNIVLKLKKALYL